MENRVKLVCGGCGRTGDALRNVPDYLTELKTICPDCHLSGKTAKCKDCGSPLIHGKGHWHETNMGG